MDGFANHGPIWVFVFLTVFRSKQSEMDWVVKRSGRNTSSSVSESVLRLRGLPFGCSKEEIAQFFTGMKPFDESSLYSVHSFTSSYLFSPIMGKKLKGVK